MEIRPQLAIEEQLQTIFTSRPMEEEELQQHVVEEQPQLDLWKSGIVTRTCQDLWKRRNCNNLLLRNNHN